MPAYLVILAFYYALLPLREYPEMTPLWKFLLSVQNIGLRGGTAFSHAWSLAVEDQFYFLLPFLLLLLAPFRRAAMVIPCVIVVAGLALRAWIAARHPAAAGGVSWPAFQQLIYYPTWGRLDPLVFGVSLAALEKHRPQIWRRITDQAWWLWLAAVGLIAYALHLGESDLLTIATCTFQFPLLALGMAALVVCAVSPRLPLRSLKIPGIAFIASIAYSVYLSHKLVIHGTMKICTRFQIPPSSVLGHVLVQTCIYAAGAALFLAVERPFLQLRQRLTR